MIGEGNGSIDRSGWVAGGTFGVIRHRLTLAQVFHKLSHDSSNVHKSVSIMLAVFSHVGDASGSISQAS